MSLYVLFRFAEECLRLAAQLRDSHAEGKNNVEKLLSINKAHRCYLPTHNVEDGLNMHPTHDQIATERPGPSWTYLLVCDSLLLYPTLSTCRC